MALRDQQGSLCKKFNRVGGRLETVANTESETEDAGSFGQHRPARAMSKFASMADVPSVPVPDTSTARKRPADVLSRAFKV